MVKKTSVNILKCVYFLLLDDLEHTYTWILYNSLLELIVLLIELYSSLCY